MTDFPASDKAIYEKLTAHASLVAAVGTVNGQIQIYNTEVPEEAVLPYVYFYNVSSPYENDAGIRLLTDELWTIEAVGSIASAARTLEGYIVEALHRQQLTFTGWSNYYCLVIDRRYRVEVEDRIKYHCRYVELRLRWSKN